MRSAAHPQDEIALTDLVLRRARKYRNVIQGFSRSLVQPFHTKTIYTLNNLAIAFFNLYGKEENGSRFSRSIQSWYIFITPILYHQGNDF